MTNTKKGMQLRPLLCVGAAYFAQKTRSLARLLYAFARDHAFCIEICSPSFLFSTFAQDHAFRVQIYPSSFYSEYFFCDFLFNSMMKIASTSNKSRITRKGEDPANVPVGTLAVGESVGRKKYR